MNFIFAHIDTILAAILATKVVAEVIVNATDTPDDDKFVGKVYRVIEWIAGIYTLKAKTLPGEAAHEAGYFLEYIKSAQGMAADLLENKAKD